MTYLPHWRATFKGGWIAGGNGDTFEQWNTSIALKPGIVRDWGTDSQDVANDLCADFSAFFTSLGAAVSTGTLFEEVRLDAIGVDGKITQEARFARPEGGPTSGSGLTVLPPQCAVVLTLDTKTRGRSRFGRMYLPLLGVTVSTDGLMGQPAVASLATKCATFITNVGNTPGADVDFAPVVASGVGSGSLNEIKAIRVGRAVDTMRSRRRSLVESYEVRDVSV